MKRVRVKVEWSPEFKAAVNAAAKELGVRPPKQMRARGGRRRDHRWVMYLNKVICRDCGIDSVTAQRRQPETGGAGPCPEAITLPWQERQRSAKRSSGS